MTQYFLENDFEIFCFSVDKDDLDKGYTTLDGKLKTHIKAIERDEVQRFLKNGGTVQEHLETFFKHHAGDHSQCLSDSCWTIDEKTGEKIPIPPDEHHTETWCQEIDDSSQKFFKKLR